MLLSRENRITCRDLGKEWILNKIDILSHSFIGITWVEFFFKKLCLVQYFIENNNIQERERGY